MTKELQERLYAILKRNQRKSEYYERKYHGKEDKHTFHGGWNLGYWEGRVAAFEECLDLLEELGTPCQLPQTGYTLPIKTAIRHS